MLSEKEKKQKMLHDIICMWGYFFKSYIQMENKTVSISMGMKIRYLAKRYKAENINNKTK